jgi:hypothetical protein
MSSTALSEAYDRFASALDELRRKYNAIFASWLASAVGEDPRSQWPQIARQISSVRQAFVDEFINKSAPAVVEALDPRAKQDVDRQLRHFEQAAHEQPVAELQVTAEDRWRPKLSRTVIGAAVGAAAALLLFVLQANSPGPSIPSNGQSIGAQQPATPTKHRRMGPPASPPSSEFEQPRLFTQSLLLAIIGAFGASIGVFLVACPPLRQLPAGPAAVKSASGRSGQSAAAFPTAPRLGPAAVLIAAIAAAAGAIALVFAAPPSLSSALFAVAALLLLALARWASFFRAGGQREIVLASAVEALDRQLVSEASTWSAVAAGLIARPAPAATRDPKLDQIRSVIVARRTRSDPAENILRIIEQELKLPSGGGSVAAEASEFVWTPSSSDQYDAVGVVNAGDVVTVLAPPRLGEEADGVREVLQKGRVMRKRASG